MAYIRKINDTKKAELLAVIGQIIKEKRKEKAKGILLLGYEYDISGSSIMQLEKGNATCRLQHCGNLQMLLA